MSPDLDALLSPRSLRLFFAERDDAGALGPYYPLGVLAERSLAGPRPARTRMAAIADGTRTPDLWQPADGPVRLAFSCETASVRVLRHFLLGSGASELAAGEEQVVDEGVRLDGTAPAALALPLAAGAGAVEAVRTADLQTTLDAGVDFTVETAANGIARIEGGRLPDGAWVAVTYRRAAPARTRFAAWRTAAVEGAARLVLEPAAGPGLVWELPRTVLRPAAELALDPREDTPSRLPFELQIHPDPETPDAPFGQPEVTPG